MVEAADLLICYKEFPHTDFVERAEEVVDLTLRTARGEIRPRMSLFDCRMIASMPTSRQPMRSFVDDINAREGKDGVLSISIAHGFSFGDVPGMGTKMLVVTDDHAELGDAARQRAGRAAVRAARPDHAAPSSASTRASTARSRSRAARW